MGELGELIGEFREFKENTKQYRTVLNEKLEEISQCQRQINGKVQRHDVEIRWIKRISLFVTTSVGTIIGYLKLK